jgi:hypothetical protein
VPLSDNVCALADGVSAAAPAVVLEVFERPVHEPIATAALPRFAGSANDTLTGWLAAPVTVKVPPEAGATVLNDVGAMLPKTRSVPFTVSAATTCAVALMEPEVPWALALPTPTAASATTSESVRRMATTPCRVVVDGRAGPDGLGNRAAGRQRACQATAPRGVGRPAPGSAHRSLSGG